MKNYEERAKSVMEKVEQLRKQSAKRRKTAVSGIACMLCLALVICVPYLLKDAPENHQSAKSNSGLVFAAEYEEIYAAIRENAADQYRTAYGTADMASAEVQNTAGAERGSGAEEEKAMAADYSGTNVQVAGIDEGDLVKTDGVYIYALQQQKILIYEAAGAETKKLSEIETETDQGKTGNAYEIFVNGDTLAVVLSVYEDPNGPEVKGKAAYDMAWIGKEMTRIDFYDISDRTKPKLKSSAGQDGYQIASRMIGEKIYLVTNYCVFTPGDPDAPETYVPCLYRGTEKETAACENIAILPESKSTAYTVVAAYDMASGKVGANQSLLGGGETIYMNQEHLFLAQNKYAEEKSALRQEGPYTVVDVEASADTVIVKYDVSEGKILLEAETEVPGHLTDQFSMDEKDGYLRVVTTRDQQSYSIFTDKEKGFENYEWKDPEISNGLYVLDENLEIAGKIENLAPGEQVYSVRFDGETGYFVTFRRVDPLFSVDLKNPKDPVILGELKIPGFSEYLHMYDEGLLFGLGYQADEKTGQTQGMKMSMFDVSDPANVTEKHQMNLGEGWSEALYNHKAILISKEKNFIGFPKGETYVIYGFDEEKGFFLRAEAETGELGYGARGLYIGDNAYLVSGDKVCVMDLKELKIIAGLSS